MVSELVSHLEIPVRDDPAALVLDDLLFLSLRRGNDGGVFGYKMPVVGIFVPQDLPGLLVGDHRLVAVGGAVPEKSKQREQQKYRRNDAAVDHCAFKLHIPACLAVYNEPGKGQQNDKESEYPCGSFVALHCRYDLGVVNSVGKAWGGYARTHCSVSRIHRLLRLSGVLGLSNVLGLCCVLRLCRRLNRRSAADTES